MKNPRVMAAGCRFLPVFSSFFLRRIQMNFTGIKDFQTRVDIVAAPFFMAQVVL